MAERILIEARNCALAVEGGAITEPEGAFDLVLRFPDGEVRPGLINAHDHLHRNHYGRLGTPPYADAHAWGRDIQRRHRREIEAGRAMPRREALLAGAWKNLLAGVTTVVHHDPWESAFDDDFPLRAVRLPCVDSLGSSPALDGIDGQSPFCLHLAEGCGTKARGEVGKLRDLGLLGPNLIAVHGVGMDRAGIEAFRVSGAALIWCPSSNLFLLGRTAPAELLREGVDVLLGSDSLLSGAGDLLDELRLARGTGLVSDERLEASVGETAARRLGLPPPSLEPGWPADLVVLSRPLLEARAADVQLVAARGVPRVAHPDLAPLLERLGGSGRIASFGGLSRWVAADGKSRQSGAAMNRKMVGRAQTRESFRQLDREMRA